MTTLSTTNVSLPATQDMPRSSPQDAIAGYYRWHARVYDMTRWTFLHGRSTLVRRIHRHMMMPHRVLEIGCGTGSNLTALSDRFPKAQIMGLDLSRDMLNRARVKVKPYGSRVGLLHRRYDAPVALNQKFDLIVLSYALTMMNPGFEEVLEHCREDLSDRGLIAVVDFHDSRHAWFRRWMGVNHVRMEGQVLQALENRFQPVVSEVQTGGRGLWEWMTFIGSKA